MKWKGSGSLNGNMRSISGDMERGTYYESTFNVPTWNYSAVHIYGNIQYIDDKEKVWELLNETTEIYEGQNGWKLPQEEKFKDLTKFIRFFEIKVANIEAKFKFNQNKTNEDIKKVIQSLRDNKQIEVANFMEHITNLRRETR